MCPMAVQKTSAVHERWWTGLNLTFQTEGPIKRPLLCSESSPKLTTTLDWPKAWTVHGDENRLPLSSEKSFGNEAGTGINARWTAYCRIGWLHGIVRSVAA